MVTSPRFFILKYIKNTQPILKINIYQAHYLHTKDVTLKGGRNACDLPAGKKVVENERTGLPFVKSA